MEVSIHTTEKYRIVGYYFKLIRDLLQKVEAFRPLRYVDLYCGDGTCEIPKIGKRFFSPVIESILRPAAQSKFSVICFLNDLDEDTSKRMEENTRDYAQFIDSIEHKDANQYYKEVLKKIPSDKFSIFYLDPTNHADLKWTTIKGIAEHAHTYENKMRRPELIVNLMTYTMTGSYMAESYQSITESLGTNEWLEEIEENQKARVMQSVSTAFFTVFKRQLEKLGYKVPTPIKIFTADTNAPMYYLVWATSNEEGYNIIEKNLIPHVLDLAKKAHKESKTELKTAKAKEKAKELGISPLEKWFSE
jgi:three-Cys-motif partner protein